MLNPTLAKNRSGRYEIRFSEQKPDGSYRSRTQSTGTASLGEAKLILAEFIRQEQDIAKAVDDPTVGHLAKRYLQAAAARNVKDSQIRTVEGVVNYFSHMTPREITPEVFLQFRLLRKVADGTLRRDLAALKTVFNFALRHKLVDPSDIPYIELPPPGAPRDLWLDENQEREFLALAYGHSMYEPRVTRLTRFAAIALDTGARKRAIEGLTWDRVRLDTNLIDFRDPKLTVSKKRRVAVPISDRLRPVLERAKSEAVSEYVLDHPGNIRKTFETWRQGTGFEWVTPHVMRHTAATLMLRAGVSVWSVAGVLGDTVETVTRVYGHHSPDYLIDAVNRRN